MNLLSSNPYLRDPVARRKALLRTAATSSAVEGIRKPFEKMRAAVKARSGKSAKSTG